MNLSSALLRRTVLTAALTVGVLAATVGSAVTVSLVAPTRAGAATATVTSASDDGSPGTLRHAVTQANATPGADVISIGEVGTITLTSALPNITEELTITGPGATLATLDGGGFQVFRINASKGAPVPLTVSGLTLTHPASATGGLVANTWGTVVLDDVLLTGITSNQPIFTLQGGRFTLRDSVAEDNTGTLIGSDHGNTPASTAAESVYDNRTYVTNSTLRDNHAGGYGCVIRTERRLYVTGSSIVDNELSAVCARGLNGAAFSSSTIARNAGDGVALAGYTSWSVEQNEATFDDMTIYDNAGVGIRNEYYSNITGLVWDPPGFRIDGSTVFGNGEGDVVGPIAGSKITDSLIGIPRPPAGVAGVAGAADAVDVTWNAPSSDSGSAVTGYTVTADPGGTTCSAVTTSCSVGGLTTGESYTFTVTAQNARGTSWPSTASDAVTPAAPTTTTTSTTTTSTSTTSTTVAPTTTAPPSTTTTTTEPAAFPPRGAAYPWGPSDLSEPAVPGLGDRSPTIAELTGLPMGLEAPDSPSTGRSFTVTAHGFEPGEQVLFMMRSTPVVLAVVLADAQGVARAEVSIPDGTEPGEHHLYAFGLDSRRGVQRAITIDAEPAALAFTGMHDSIVLTGFVLLGGGAVLLLLAQRRRPAR